MDNKVKGGIIGALLGVIAGIGVSYKKNGKDFIKYATYGAIGGMACGGLGLGAGYVAEKIKFEEKDFTMESVAEPPVEKKK